MKVIILAGGFGTRLSEFTNIIPKPMVTIGELPIIWHIMNYYSHFNHNEFLIALGYKSNVIKDYFLALNNNTSDFKVSLSTGKINYFNRSSPNWEVSLIDTGLNTMTGGRIKRLESYFEPNETFLLTYGDGLSNVNLNDLVKLHFSNQSALTVTAVKPPARFGELCIQDSTLTAFEEKNQLKEGWINGGFMVADTRIFNFIKSDDELFEREPLNRLIENCLVSAYKHNGFWQCMDSKRDNDTLNDLWNKGSAPWIF
tara:strand:+ start:75636 stop:76403 length:768 start_codon:yes stop_codon:yes gene_type:complete